MIGDMKETMVEMFARYSDKKKKKNYQVFNEVAAFKHEVEAVKEKVNTLKISVADTSKRIDDTSVRIDNVKNKDLPALTGDINKVRADLEEKLLLYEIHDRKLNLLIYMVLKSRRMKTCIRWYTALWQIFWESLGNKRRLPSRW